VIREQLDLTVIYCTKKNERANFGPLRANRDFLDFLKETYELGMV
jgi:hypothetical protein